MKYTYTQLDSSLSLAMLEQALKNQTVKAMLVDIPVQLQANILQILIDQENSDLSPNLKSLAMQHSSGDKFIGALLPDFTQHYLENTKEGRKLLLTTIDNCLKNADKITTPHDFLALMKVIDGMAFVYDEFETNKENPEHINCKNYISPTSDETSIRSYRSPKFFAKTYGIGTEAEADLVNPDSPGGCWSGKARFFILPAEHRARTWFEKLANQSSYGRPSLPLIASPSNAAAKNFIMAHGIELFKQKNGLFDIKKAQMFANCLMAYLVYCGHHSFLEVVEIWNRQIDFLVIEKLEQLSKDIILKTPTHLKYIDDPEVTELRLPYGIVGDYDSFLHPDYADEVIQYMKNYLDEGLDLTFNGPHSTINLSQ